MPNDPKTRYMALIAGIFLGFILLHYEVMSIPPWLYGVSAIAGGGTLVLLILRMMKLKK